MATKFTLLRRAASTAFWTPAKACSRVATNALSSVVASFDLRSKWIVFTGVSSDASATHDACVSRPLLNSSPKPSTVAERPATADAASSNSTSLPKRRGAFAASSFRNLYHHEASRWSSFFVIEMSRMSWAEYMRLT